MTADVGLGILPILLDSRLRGNDDMGGRGAGYPRGESDGGDVCE